MGGEELEELFFLSYLLPIVGFSCGEFDLFALLTGRAARHEIENSIFF